MSLAQKIAEHFDPQCRSKAGGEYNARCPNHAAHENGDKNKSFSIKDNPSKPMGVEFNCFVCGPKPLVQFIIDTGLLPKKGQKPPKEASSSASSMVKIRKEKEAKKLAAEKAKKDLEKRLAKLAEPAAPEPGEEYVFDTYYYNDEKDEPYVRVIRYNKQNSKEKRFLPQRFEGGKWIDGLGDPPITVPLLNIVEVRKTARSGGMIYLVEGEKLSKILTNFRLTATTNIGGANKPWDHIWTLSLLGAEVAIISDNNKTGRNHSLTAARELFDYGVKVKLVMLPGLTNPKDDLEQWLEKNTIADFLKLVKSADYFGPDQVEPEEVLIDFKTFANTDTANAERLAARYGRDLKWTEEKGWFVWDKRRYKANKQLPILLTKKNAQLISQEAEQCYGKEQKILYEWAKTSESLSKRRACLELVKGEPGIECSVRDFDRDEYILNCQNGVLSLLDGKRVDHNRKYMCSRIMPVTYDPKAKCPNWDRFLLDITDGDEEMIAFLRRCVGYTISGSTAEECLFFLWGHGRNGKSKFVETIVKMMGDYGAAIPTESLMDISGRETARHDLASLDGARIVSASETQEGQRLNEALVKRMTGGENMRVRNLYHDFFDLAPVWKLWITGNYKPQIKGQDPAIWERLYLIPFNVYIEPKRRDPFLMQKLLAELPGILNWSKEGFIDYHYGVKGADGQLIRGLRAPDKILETRENYKRDQDTVGSFIDDCCVVQSWAKALGKDLYAAYVKHCKEREMYNKSDKTFYETLEMRSGITSERTRRGKEFKGIGLSVQDIKSDWYGGDNEGAA